MTRKDYIKLASIIKDSSYSDGQIDGQRRHVLDRREFMHALCGMLEDDNPNFNEPIFREATGEIPGE
jgi:hypothetical protein